MCAEQKNFLTVVFCYCVIIFFRKAYRFPKRFQKSFYHPRKISKCPEIVFISVRKIPKASKKVFGPFRKFRWYRKKFLACSENSEGIEKSFLPVRKIPKASKKFFDTFRKFRRHKKEFSAYETLFFSVK